MNFKVKWVCKGKRGERFFFLFFTLFIANIQRLKQAIWKRMLTLAKVDVTNNTKKNSLYVKTRSHNNISLALFSHTCVPAPRLKSQFTF